MPNFLGTAGPGSNNFPVQCPLYDPRNERANRVRFRRNIVPELEYANSFYTPAGQWPSRGWLLVRRGDYTAINTYTDSIVLQIDDSVNPALTFRNLAIVQARCVSAGLPNDPDSIMLVEVTDARGVLWTPWFSFPTTDQFNIRSPAYPEQYYSATLRAGAAWTWDQMIGDLWGDMGAYLGTYPGTAGITNPLIGTPEGWSFPGVSCWLALNQVLDYLGLSLIVDLTSTTPFTIVSNGDPDAAFSALQAAHVDQLEDDFQWIDTGSGRVPGLMIVYFHRRTQYYGTEETVRRDTRQWATSPLYSVTLSSPAQFVTSPGIGHLWSDFTVRYDIDGNPLAADVATAATIAAQRVQQFFYRIYRGTEGYLRQIYAGALPFKGSSMLDGVCWKMTFPEGERFSWQTEIIRGANPPWPQVEVKPDTQGM